MSGSEIIESPCAGQFCERVGLRHLGERAVGTKRLCIFSFEPRSELPAELPKECIAIGDIAALEQGAYGKYPQPGNLRRDEHDRPRATHWKASAFHKAPQHFCIGRQAAENV